MLSKVALLALATTAVVANDPGNKQPDTAGGDGPNTAGGRPSCFSPQHCREAATGASCKGGFQCATCNENFTLDQRSGYCKPDCVSTQEVDPVCCRGKDFGNRGKAFCSDPLQAASCKVGTCDSNKSCKEIGNADETSCNANPGCEYTGGVCKKKDNKGDARNACVKVAMDLSAGSDLWVGTETAGKHKTFYDQLKSCEPPVSDMEIKRKRVEFANTAENAKAGDYKIVMGIGAETELTRDQKQEQNQGKREGALGALGESCYDCVMADPTDTTCKADAVRAFKDAFGADVPTDNEIKSMFKQAASMYANQIREGCSAETDSGIKTACVRSAVDAGLSAQCKVVGDDAASKTAQVEAARDTADAALGEVCTKAAADCLVDQKAALKELTGEDATDTEIIGRMKKIAGKKAAAVMSDCTKTMDFTKNDDTVKAARKACFDTAKAEYKKFDDTDLKDSEIGAVLEDVALEEASEVFSTCFGAKTNKDKADKKACAQEASKEVAGRTGVKPPEMTAAPTFDFLAKLKAKGERIASDAQNDCLVAGATVDECKTRFKEELASRTGIAEADIDDKEIVNAQRRKDEEEARNAMKAFTENQKSATACSKTAVECAKDKRAALAAVLSKQFGGEVVDDLAVEKYKKSAAETEAKKIMESCRSQGKARSDCDAELKDAIASVTGEVPTDLQLGRAKRESEAKQLQEYAAELAKDDTKNADQKRADRLAKYKEIRGDTGLKEEDLKVEEKEAAKAQIGLLLKNKDKGDAAAVKTAIEEAIKQQTGATDVTEEEVETFKKFSIGKNMANLFQSGQDAGYTKEQRDSEFKKELRAQLGLADDADIELKAAEYKEHAQRAAVKDVTDAKDIAIDASDSDRKTAVDEKIAAIRAAMKSVDGKEAKTYEAETFMKAEARNSMMELSKSMGSSGTKDYARLKEIYQQKTGKKDVKDYEIKNDLKEAAKESDDLRNCMKGNGDAASKRLAFKSKMKELTGEELTDLELVHQVKDMADKKLFEVAKTYSKSRGDASATSVEDKKAEKDAKKLAFTESMGRAPKSDAEVVKSFNEALTKAGGNEFFECLQAVEGTATREQKQACASDTAAKYASVAGSGTTFDRDAILYRAKEAEKTKAVETSNQCLKEKTAAECLVDVTAEMKKIRGGAEVKDFEAKNLIVAGATKELGPILAECDGDATAKKTCRNAAFADFKTKAFDPLMTKEQFEMNIEKGASKDALEIAKGCDKTDATVDCGDVLMKAYRASRGKKDDAKVKRKDAVVAANKAFKEEAASLVKSCEGTKAECRQIVKDKMMEAKTWDKREGAAAEVTDVDVERSIKHGAIVAAKNTFKACRGIAVALTDSDAKQTKISECKDAFRDEFVEAFPDLKSAKDGAAAIKEVAKAKKGAQVNAAKDAMEAALSSKEENAASKTPQEVRDLLKEAILASAPIDDETDLDDKFKMEDLREEAGQNSVEEAARTCVELGDECVISKDVVPADGGRRFLASHGLEALEAKTIRLGEESFKASGESLEGKKPTKEDEEKTTRKAAKKILKKAVKACKDAGFMKKDMKACVVKDAQSVVELIRGDKKNEAKDMKEALEDDALDEVFDCAKNAGKMTDACKKTFEDRLKVTNTDYIEDPTPTKGKLTKMMQAAIKRVSEKLEVKEKVGKTVKADEKKARDDVKDEAKKLGLPDREVDLALQLGAKMKAVKAGADAKKAGKTDTEVSAVIKAEMENDPDAPDYEPKKAELLKAAKAVAEGGVKGDLKFKPMKTVSCRVCVTSDTKTLTADTLKKVVEDVKKAKDLVNADEAKVTEMPKKDTVTKRTCGTIAYPPKAGMKTEDVKKEFEKLEVTVRRSLAGHLDGDETTTSTAETQDIVTGDDNSEASDPAGSDDKDDDEDKTSTTPGPAAEEDEKMSTNAGERLATHVGVVLATFAAVAAALL